MAARDDHAEPGDEVTRKVLRGLSGPLPMRAGRLWPRAEDGAVRLPRLDRRVTGLTMADSERGWPRSDSGRVRVSGELGTASTLHAGGTVVSCLSCWDTGCYG
jgi:hypothetical protein